MPENTDHYMFLLELCREFNEWIADIPGIPPDEALYGTSACALTTNGTCCMMVGTGGEVYLWYPVDGGYIVRAFAATPGLQHILMNEGTAEFLDEEFIDSSPGVMAAMVQFINFIREECQPALAQHARRRSMSAFESADREFALLREVTRRGGTVLSGTEAVTPAGNVVVGSTFHLCTIWWTLDGRTEAFPAESFDCLMAASCLPDVV